MTWLSNRINRWWHRIGTPGSLQEVARAAGWKSEKQPGQWVKVIRTFRDGSKQTWWALEVQAGPYGREKTERAVIATTDPERLPDNSTWYLVTNLPAPESAKAETSGLAVASLAEVIRLYGLRMWIEQSYKQVKHALGWSEYQVRSDRAIRRHWQLVCCAFSFCWYHHSHHTGDQTWLPEHCQMAERQEQARAQSEGTEEKTNEQAVRRAALLSWPKAGRSVRAWLQPWVMLQRYWHAWSEQPPPFLLQCLLDQLGRGQQLFLYSTF